MLAAAIGNPDKLQHKGSLLGYPIPHTSEVDCLLLECSWSSTDTAPRWTFQEIDRDDVYSEPLSNQSILVSDFARGNFTWTVMRAIGEDPKPIFVRDGMTVSLSAVIGRSRVRISVRVSRGGSRPTISLEFSPNSPVELHVASCLLMHLLGSCEPLAGAVLSVLNLIPEGTQIRSEVWAELLGLCEKASLGPLGGGNPRIFPGLCSPGTAKIHDLFLATERDKL